MVDLLMSGIAQIISVAFNAFIEAIVSIFSFDMEYFNKTFPFAANAYPIIQTISLGIALLIAAVHIIPFFMGGKQQSSPIRIGLHTIFAVGFIYYGNYILTAIMEIAQYPYSALAGTATGSGFGGEAIGDAIGSVVELGTILEDTFATQSILLYLIVFLLIAFAFLKMIIEIVERYVILFVLIYLSPLAASTIASETTFGIYKRYLSMFISQCILMVLSVWSLKMVASLFNNFYASENDLLVLLMGYAFIRISNKIDSYLGQLGLSAATTGAGLGSELMAAGMGIAAMFSGGKKLPGKGAMGDMAGAAGAGGVGNILGAGMDKINGVGNWIQNHSPAAAAGKAGLGAAKALGRTAAQGVQAGINAAGTESKFGARFAKFRQGFGQAAKDNLGGNLRNAALDSQSNVVNRGVERFLRNNGIANSPDATGMVQDMADTVKTGGKLDADQLADLEKHPWMARELDKLCDANNASITDPDTVASLAASQMGAANMPAEMQEAYQVGTGQIDADGVNFSKDKDGIHMAWNVDGKQKEMDLRTKDQYDRLSPAEKAAYTPVRGANGAMMFMKSSALSNANVASRAATKGIQEFAKGNGSTPLSAEANAAVRKDPRSLKNLQNAIVENKGFVSGYSQHGPEAIHAALDGINDRNLPKDVKEAKAEAMERLRTGDFDKAGTYMDGHSVNVAWTDENGKHALAFATDEKTDLGAAPAYGSRSKYNLNGEDCDYSYSRPATAEEAANASLNKLFNAPAPDEATVDNPGGGNNGAVPGSNAAPQINPAELDSAGENADTAVPSANPLPVVSGEEGETDAPPAEDTTNTGPAPAEDNADAVIPDEAQDFAPSAPEDYTAEQAGENLEKFINGEANDLSAGTLAQLADTNPDAVVGAMDSLSADKPMSHETGMEMLGAMSPEKGADAQAYNTLMAGYSQDSADITESHGKGMIQLSNAKTGASFAAYTEEGIKANGLDKSKMNAMQIGGSTMYTTSSRGASFNLGATGRSIPVPANNTGVNSKPQKPADQSAPTVSIPGVPAKDAPPVSDNFIAPKPTSNGVIPVGTDPSQNEGANPAAGANVSPGTSPNPPVHTGGTSPIAKPASPEAPVPLTPNQIDFAPRPAARLYTSKEAASSIDQFIKSGGTSSITQGAMNTYQRGYGSAASDAPVRVLNAVQQPNQYDAGTAMEIGGSFRNVGSPNVDAYNSLMTQMKAGNTNVVASSPEAGVFQIQNNASGESFTAYTPEAATKHNINMSETAHEKMGGSAMYYTSQPASTLPSPRMIPATQSTVDNNLRQQLRSNPAMINPQLLTLARNNTAYSGSPDLAYASFRALDFKSANNKGLNDAYVQMDAAMHNNRMVQSNCVVDGHTQTLAFTDAQGGTYTMRRMDEAAANQMGLSESYHPGWERVPNLAPKGSTQPVSYSYVAQPQYVSKQESDIQKRFSSANAAPLTTDQTAQWRAENVGQYYRQAQSGNGSYIFDAGNPKNSPDPTPEDRAVFREVSGIMDAVKQNLPKGSNLDRRAFESVSQALRKGGEDVLFVDNGKYGTVVEVEASNPNHNDSGPSFYRATILTKAGYEKNGYADNPDRAKDFQEYTGFGNEPLYIGMTVVEPHKYSSMPHHTLENDRAHHIRGV